MMEVNCKELATVFDWVKPAIPAQGDEDLIRKVIFTGEDIVGFSEDLIVMYPFKTDFVGALPSTEFISLVKKIGDHRINLQPKKDMLLVTSDETAPSTILKSNMRLKLKASIKMDTQNRAIEELKAFDMDSSLNWEDCPADLSEAIKYCSMSIGTQDNLALNCLHFNNKHISSSDDFRISRYELKEVFKGDVLLKGRACGALIDRDIDCYAVGDVYVRFVIRPNILVALRRIEADPFAGDPYFDFEGPSYELTDKLAHGLDRVGIFTQGIRSSDKLVTVQLKDGEIILKGSADIGEAEIKLASSKLKIKSPIALIINPVYLAEILKVVGTKIKIGKDRALFTNGSFSHLIGITMGGNGK